MIVSNKNLNKYDMLIAVLFHINNWIEIET